MHSSAQQTGSHFGVQLQVVEGRRLKPVPVPQVRGEGTAHRDFVSVHQVEHDPPVPAFDPLDGCARDPVRAMHLGPIQILDFAQCVPETHEEEVAAPVGWTSR